jgi:hypothetical protein
VEEGSVLAYDLDPQGTISHPAAGYDWPSLQAPEDVRQVCTLARRAVEVGTLGQRSRPVEFMEWARSIGVEFHADWWGAVVGEAMPAGQTLEAPAVELKTREQASLLKMVVGMAIAYYGWDRNELRSDATAVIESDLARVGVPLDPDTIRKWLRKGAELIPGPDP